MSNGRGPVTMAALYGPDAAQPAAYGLAIGGAPAAAPAAAAPGSGSILALPKDFWRTSGFGLILLLGLVVYFDVRLLNR